MPGLSQAQKDALDRDNRQVSSAGYRLSDVITDLFTLIATGSLGGTASGAEIDAFALNGGAFAWDGVTSSLNFAYGAGRIRKPKVNVSVAGSSILLSASSTNYVEVDDTGTVSSNTSGFTAGRVPLYTVVTGASTISTVTNAKAAFSITPAKGIDGTLLSDDSGTKVLAVTLGTVSATTAGLIVVPFDSTLVGFQFVSKDAQTTSDSNYFTFGLINKSDSDFALALATSVNTTKTTGGSAITAYTARAFDLATLTVGNERDVTEGDVLEWSITKTGSPTNQTESALMFYFRVNG